MFWKHRGRNRKQEVKTSDLFLKKCFILVLFWIVTFSLIIAFLVLKDTGSSSKDWAKGLFTAACILDALVTAKIIPITLKVLKDEIYKDKTVKRGIWKLRGLMLGNLIFSTSFIVWCWAASQDSKIIKWLLFVCLLLGILIIKALFTTICIKLKRYMSRLYVEFRIVSKESETPSSPEEPTPPSLLSSTEGENTPPLLN